MPTVSIVIRSRNDAALAKRVMDSIFSQDFKDFEVLNFDNNSTDGTKEIISSYPNVRMFDVKEGEYIPGKVLNEAIKNCKGKVVVFNNSDSVPLGNDWLENIIRPILNDGYTAVYARQVCRANADWWVKLDYSRAFGQTRFSEDFFSLASSAALVSALREYLFDPTIQYSEDVQWARKMKNLGFKVGYAPNARAEHSHNYTLKSAKKRFLGEGKADAEIYQTKQSVWSLFRGIVCACLRDFAYLIKIGKPHKIFESIKMRSAQKYYYFKGRNDEFENLAK